jgi:hypothetical protein
MTPSINRLNAGAKNGPRAYLSRGGSADDKGANSPAIQQKQIWQICMRARLSTVFGQCEYRERFDRLACAVTRQTKKN